MSDFASRLLDWYDTYGRRDLPWRTPGDPYPIWVSEIMLQQTQVATVLPYYHAFMQRFPNIAALAQAPLDAVLHRWTGLGYYARARNLHRAAQIVVADHAGVFPREYDAVAALPGIGPSTAGAILAFAFDAPHAILDGNVKRVLARYHRVAGATAKTAVARTLWTHAREHTPRGRVGDYTQAIMDLGAGVCRRIPDCAACPVQSGCAAYAHGEIALYPTPARRRALPVKTTAMIMIHGADGVLLKQRPPTGIWGGLWSFPECAGDVPAYCRDTLGLDVQPAPAWPTVRHTFSHFHLDIAPVPARLLRATDSVMEPATYVWYKPDSPDARGLAAPVKRLLEQLRTTPWPAP